MTTIAVGPELRHGHLGRLMVTCPHDHAELKYTAHRWLDGHPATVPNPEPGWYWCGLHLWQRTEEQEWVEVDPSLFETPVGAV